MIKREREEGQKQEALLSERTMVIPQRLGPRPRTTPRTPHLQQDQHGAPEMSAMLAERVFALPDIEEGQSTISDPRSRAFWLKRSVPAGPPNAFLGRREIGHFHPWDGSMHVMLPPDVVRQAVASGWAEVHPVAAAGMAPENLVMVYSPRDEQEVNVLFALLQAAYRYAGGRLPEHTEKRLRKKEPYPLGRIESR